MVQDLPNYPPGQTPPGPPQPWRARWRDEDRKTLHILVVDDEPDIRESLRAALSRTAGVEVLTVADAREAQRLLDATRCDLLLLDERLQGMQGSELLQWMRTRRLTTPTILLTGVPKEELSASALGLAGALHVLRKPVDLSELLAAVHRLARPRA